MSENWTAVASEIAAGLAEVGYAATVTRPAQTATAPHDVTPEGAATQFTVTVLDDGIKDRYEAGSLVASQVHMITIGATGYVPQKRDRIALSGGDFEFVQIMPTAPGGVDLLYEIEVKR